MSFIANLLRVHTFPSIVLILIALGASGEASAAPSLHLSGDLTPAGDLEIGGDLSVAMTGAMPFERFSFFLTDDTGSLVARLAETKANIGGEIPGRLLWERTGVVGCDVGAVHDPANYQYQSFDEADSLLDGRTFRVRLTEGWNFNKVVAEVALPLRVLTPFIDGHASDGAGCLRTELTVADPLHLAIEHQGPFGLDVRVYLVAAQAIWLLGDPLIDVRGGAQMMHIPAAANPWVELMWLAPLEGQYQVIVTPVDYSGPYDPTLALLIKLGFSVGGARVQDCGGVCPP